MLSWWSWCLPISPSVVPANYEIFHGQIKLDEWNQGQALVSWFTRQYFHLTTVEHKLFSRQELTLLPVTLLRKQQHRPDSSLLPELLLQHLYSQSYPECGNVSCSQSNPFTVLPPAQQTSLLALGLRQTQTTDHVVDSCGVHSRSQHVQSQFQLGSAVQNAQFLLLRRQIQYGSFDCGVLPSAALLLVFLSACLEVLQSKISSDSAAEVQTGEQSQFHIVASLFGVSHFSKILRQWSLYHNLSNADLIAYDCRHPVRDCSDTDAWLFSQQSGFRYLFVLLSEFCSLWWILCGWGDLWLSYLE